jgi:hypothetical protein
VGVLGYAAAKGGGHVGGRRTAADEGPRQDRAAANRRPDAGAVGAATGGPRREQDPRKKPLVRSAALTFRYGGTDAGDAGRNKFKHLVMQAMQTEAADAGGAGTFRVQWFSVAQPMGLQPVK